MLIISRFIFFNHRGKWLFSLVVSLKVHDMTSPKSFVLFALYCLVRDAMFVDGVNRKISSHSHKYVRVHFTIEFIVTC